MCKCMDVHTHTHTHTHSYGENITISKRKFISYVKESTYVNASYLALRSIWTQFFCIYRQWDCHMPHFRQWWGVWWSQGWLKQWKRRKGRWTWAWTSTKIYLSTQCLQNSNHSMHIALASITKTVFSIWYWRFHTKTWGCKSTVVTTDIFQKSYFYTGIQVTLYLFLPFVD